MLILDEMICKLQLWSKRVSLQACSTLVINKFQSHIYTIRERHKFSDFGLRQNLDSKDTNSEIHFINLHIISFGLLFIYFVHVQFYMCYRFLISSGIVLLRPLKIKTFKKNIRAYKDCICLKYILSLIVFRSEKKYYLKVQIYVTQGILREVNILI